MGLNRQQLLVALNDLDIFFSKDFQATLYQSLPILIHGNVHGGPKHNETIIRHMELCLTAMCERSSSELLRLAAYLHDIGKIHVAMTQNENITFHMHDVIGADIVYNWMLSIGFKHNESKYVSRLIRLHMWHFEVTPSIRTIRRWLKKVGKNYQDLLTLRECDRSANLARVGQDTKSFTHLTVEKHIETLLKSGDILFYSQLNLSSTSRSLLASYPTLTKKILDDLVTYVNHSQWDVNRPAILYIEIERKIKLYVR